MKFINSKTKDGLELPGVHWETKKQNTCVIFVHGMGGNILEENFPIILGDYLSSKNISLIYGHNRGHSQMNYVKTDKFKFPEGSRYKFCGQAHDRFSKCVLDIDAWVDTAKKLGYKNIVLLGHSLGCNKIIHYYAKSKKTNRKLISKIIFASPPDMVGLLKMEGYQPDYNKLLSEAKRLVSLKKPQQILSGMVWDWYYVSAQTFLDFFVDKCPGDNLPVWRNPKRFLDLEKINVPVLSFMAEYDEIKIRSLKEDLELIKSKAINCPEFLTKLIKGTNHLYEKKEQILSKVIYNWIIK